MSAVTFRKDQMDQCWNLLPNELTLKVLGYCNDAHGLLDKKVTMAINGVCKAWRENPCIIQAKETHQKRAAVRHTFRRDVQPVIRRLSESPREIIQLFGNPRFLNLPQLSSEKFPLRPDLLKPAHMTHPIMGFKYMGFNERVGRPGIAFHIEGHSEKQSSLVLYRRGDKRINEIAGVLAVFQRHLDHINPWVVGMGGDLSYAMRLDHEKTGVHSQGMTSSYPVSLQTLSDLLKGSGPLYRIAQGYVPPAQPPAEAEGQSTNYPI